MAQRNLLLPSELPAALQSIPDWTIVNGKLHREFKFKDFSQAFAFMTRVALVAERINHHPEWSNVYNRVMIDLTTHDLGGISTFDLESARAIDNLLN
jgi:4a-hydroxytetrahydrobiopterin dehydratase